MGFEHAAFSTGFKSLLKFIFDFKQGKEKLEKEKIIIEARISSSAQFSKDKNYSFSNLSSPHPYSHMGTISNCTLISHSCQIYPYLKSTFLQNFHPTISL